MPGEPITILCVDDSPDITALLAMAIKREPDMKCVGTVAEGASVLTKVKELKPAVVLLDLSIPNADALELARRINCDFPQTRTIMYSGYDDPQSIDRAIDAGAWGFVSKHQELPKVIETIRQVARGEVATRK